jgi:hypothetical protein
MSWSCGYGVDERLSVDELGMDGAESGAKLRSLIDK